MGDCRDILPDVYGANLIIADPPYGIKYVSNRRKAGRTAPIAEDDFAPIDTVELMAEACAENAAIYIFTRFDVFQTWRDAISEAGLKNKTPIVWDKQNHTSGDLFGDYGNRVELILFCHKGRHLLKSGRDNNLWSISRGRTGQDHPTPKPVAIMERIIINSTDAGQLVVDPFMGCGPAAVAAAKLGRRFIGIECDEQYFNIACERIRGAIL